MSVVNVCFLFRSVSFSANRTQYERLKVEDCNSFTLAIYTSVVVTAMECIRIIQVGTSLKDHYTNLNFLQDIEYPVSCRFERKFEICAARGAQWDILLYYTQRPAVSHCSFVLETSNES
jgi:hypothetical protein